MDIREIRNRIDAVDAEMAQLFEQRMSIVEQVADYKRQRGLPIEDNGREQEVIEKQSAHIGDDRIRALYVSFQQQLMEISKRWQRIILSGINVACTGTSDSAGYKAAAKKFPEGNIVSFEKCRDAYRAVETGECEVAVLPVENSYSGEVGKVYDLIFSGNLHVNDIFAVEDDDSTTRYALLSGTNSDLTGEDEFDSLLIMFTVRDEVGGLAKAINIISAYDFNMRVLRSRPLKGLEWHYYFYAELEGDCSSENVEKIRRALSAACPAVKIVGTISNTGDISRNRSDHKNDTGRAADDM